jgi:hypothetical protein
MEKRHARPSLQYRYEHYDPMTVPDPDDGGMDPDDDAPPPKEDPEKDSESSPDS